MFAEIDGKEVEPHDVVSLITSPNTKPIQPEGGLTPSQEYADQAATKNLVKEHGKTRRVSSGEENEQEAKVPIKPA